MGAMEAELLVHGMAAARSGNTREALYYLEWLLRMNPTQHQQTEALYWLSEVAETKAEARDRLESLLSIDPFDLRARRKLGILDGKIQPDSSFNPDAVQNPAPQVSQPAEGRRFTCPKCGGRLTYSADGSSLVCEFCEARQHLGGPVARGEDRRASDFLEAMISGRGHWRPQAELALHCAGCGAVFIVPPAHLSMNCPYCDSPHATHQPAQELILPNQVVPFEIGEVAAKESNPRLAYPAFSH